MEAWGLGLNALGAILVAYGQWEVSRVVDMWLKSHELFIRSFLEDGGRNIIRITGVDIQMTSAVVRNRWLSLLGWALFVVGVVMQLVPHIKS